MGFCSGPLAHLFRSRPIVCFGILSPLGFLGILGLLRSLIIPLDPAHAIHLLLAELRRRRAEGVRTVELSAAGETALADLIRRAKGDATSDPIPATESRREVAPARPAFRPAEPEPRAKAEPLPAKVAAPRTPRVDDADVPPPPEVVIPDQGDKAARLGALRDRVLACPECRRQRAPGARPVFGAGSPDADLLIVGEAPGAEEEAAGEPFVGPSGQILAKAVAAMGLSRESVYLAYLMRWRPVMANGLGERAPTAREAAFCLPYLRAEIAIVRPRAIVALGNSVLNGLMGLEGDKALRITRQRGNWLELDGVPVMPTYHPSYLLRNPSPVAKREFWTDLLAVMERLGMPISERQRGFYAPPPQRGLSE